MMPPRLLLVSALLCTFGSFVQANFPVNLGCFDSSNYKWINLVRSHSIGFCSYEIRPYNGYVCQLRVEFSTDLLPAENGPNGAAPKCREGSKITIGGFDICGSNQNQHLYVSFDGSHLSSTEFITANLTEGPGIYRIKVTQIECPFGIRRSIEQLSGQFGSWYNNWHTSVASLTRNNVLYDVYQVAPESCDQYHISTRGFVESLSYNAGKGPYPYNTPLKVCFKTPPNSKILRLTGLDFNLDDNLPVNLNMYGIDCTATMPGLSDDYIIIPSSKIIGKGISSDKYCGDILQGEKVEANLYETAHFISHPGESRGLGVRQRHYRFKYEIH